MEHDLALRWGAGQDTKYMISEKFKEIWKDFMNAYVDLRRRQGRRPFIDAPHFEVG